MVLFLIHTLDRHNTAYNIMSYCNENFVVGESLVPIYMCDIIMHARTCSHVLMHVHAHAHTHT